MHLTAEVVEGEKCGHAEQDGEQQQRQLHPALRAGRLRMRDLSTAVHQLGG